MLRDNGDVMKKFGRTAFSRNWMEEEKKNWKKKLRDLQKGTRIFQCLFLFSLSLKKEEHLEGDVSAAATAAVVTIEDGGASPLSNEKEKEKRKKKKKKEKRKRSRTK